MLIADEFHEHFICHLKSLSSPQVLCNKVTNRKFLKVAVLHFIILHMKFAIVYQMSVTGTRNKEV